MNRNGWFALYARGTTGVLGTAEHRVALIYSEGLGEGPDRLSGEEVAQGYLHYIQSMGAGGITVRYEYLGTKLVPALAGRVA